MDRQRVLFFAYESLGGTGSDKMAESRAHPYYFLTTRGSDEQNSRFLKINGRVIPSGEIEPHAVRPKIDFVTGREYAQEWTLYAYVACPYLMLLVALRWYIGTKVECS